MKYSQTWCETINQSICFKGVIFVCLFVCLGFFVPLDNFSLIRRRHHQPWRAAKFDPCALMTIEQWGFFSVVFLLIIMVISSPRTNATHIYIHSISSLRPVSLPSSLWYKSVNCTKNKNLIELFFSKGALLTGWKFYPRVCILA